MLARPQPTEAAPYYSRYIDLVSSDDVIVELETQLDETLAFLSGIPEETSLHRYAAEKWSIREVLSHMNDCERVFAFRAFWFARGFSDPLPSFDQEVCVTAAKANDVSWASHVEEFRMLRLATLSFLRNLPAEAWQRKGIASDNSFTVRALAYILAGHVTHHTAVIRDRYL
ncbi:MAG: DinB family protein [Pyrinomonadaceae bacterium]